ncbi:MAG: hypothetical protein ACYC4L_04600 [Chloroflexota bacterium]
MKIEARGDGLIVNLTTEQGERAMLPEPDEPSQALEFDETSNAALAAALVARPVAYRLQTGALYREGQAVGINPPATAYSERRQALTLAQGLKQYNALANPTNAQSVAAIRANNRLTLVLARLLLRELAAE